MIVTLLEINAEATAIQAIVSADTGNKITKVLAWNKETYKIETDAVDLSSLLSGVSEDENFVVTNTDLGVSSIIGLWVIEFYSDESATPEGPQEGVVVNLVPYHECVVDKAVGISVKNCREAKNNCGKSSNLLYASTLLDTVGDTILFELINETRQILFTLDELCEVCTNCPEYAGSLSHTGFSYKTISNIIVKS